MSIINLDELKQQQQTLAIKHKESIKNSEAKTAVTNDDGAAQNTETDNIAKITLSGPLSQIYTKALNIMYANENIIELKTMLSDSEEEKDNKDLYMYCCDDKEVDIVDATNKLTIALDQGYKNVAIVTECNKNKLSDKLIALENLARSLKVKMFFSQKSAMEAVKIAVENRV